MAGGLEEPILSTLGKESQAPELFMNAFYKASQINLQKQNMERQMMALQSDLAYKREAHDLNMQQFAWRQKMDLANLDRMYSAQQSADVYRDRTASRLEDKLTWDMGRRDAEEEDAQKYNDDLTAWRLEHPDDFQNQDALNKLAIIQDRHTSVMGTKSGKAVTSNFNRMIDGAVKQAHFNADNIRKTIDNSLAQQDHGGQGFSRADLDRPEQAFHTKGDTIMVAEKPVMLPDGRLRWDTVPPADMGWLDQTGKTGLTMDEQKKQGIRVRSTNKNSWSTLTDLHKRELQIGGQDLSKKPGQFSPRQDLSQYEGKVINQGGQRYKVVNGEPVPVP